MNQELHKPFAIFQNDNTEQSWIWLEDTRQWQESDPDEFIVLQTLAKCLRSSNEPIQLLKDTIEAAEDDTEIDDDIDLF